MEMALRPNNQLSNLLLRRLVRRARSTTRVRHPRLPNGHRGSGMIGKLESNVGMFGIARKVFIFAMVSVAHLVDGVLGDGHLFRDAVAFFYIANELLSIIENGGKLGAPIPPAIRQAIEVLKGKGGDGGIPGNYTPDSKESFVKSDHEDTDQQTRDEAK